MISKFDLQVVPDVNIIDVYRCIKGYKSEVKYKTYTYIEHNITLYLW